MFCISIHSLVKRETVHSGNEMGSDQHFNPLPRKEGDFLHEHAAAVRAISIHSLVKRETIGEESIETIVVFQSTPS